jgi:hypothetical protein
VKKRYNECFILLKLEFVLLLGSSIVTRAALEQVYQQLLLADSVKDDSHEHLFDGETVDPNRYFHVIDAFKMPKVVFNHRRKVFER